MALRAKSFWVIACVGMILCLGCATTASNQNLGQSALSAGALIRLSRWIVGDDAFNEKLTFSDARTRGTNDFMEVQVTIRNLTPKTIDYETMFEWFDAQGFKVDSAVEMWKPGLIYGRATQEIKAIAPTSSVASYRFHIRRSNPIL